MRTSRSRGAVINVVGTGPGRAATGVGMGLEARYVRKIRGICILRDPRSFARLHVDSKQHGCFATS